MRCLVWQKDELAEQRRCILKRDSDTQYHTEDKHEDKKQKNGVMSNED